MANTTQSAGARKLADKGSQRDIADKLGVSQQAVSGWLSGRCRPSGERLLAIKREYRIPIEDWYPKADSASG